MLRIKRRTICTIARSRRWANTMEGEKIITQTMTSLAALAIAVGGLLFVGYMM